LVQTVFFKIIKYRNQYRAEEGSFVTWMFRIAHNANIDHYHSLERRRNEVRIGEADVRGDGDPDEDFLKKERSRRIREALGRLTGDQREVLILSRYQGLKYDSLKESLEFRIHGIDKDYIDYCRELLKGKKELTPELVVKMKINGI